MGLSYDIISEFVKVTNGNKEKPKEGIVYATIVQASDGKYVKIDGSDLLTPTDTTTDIEDGERVTVMIKDHRATVTGNVTAPSASGNRVDKVVEVVSDQLGVFETVVADKVSTNELEAYKATIEHLIAGKAEIEDLEATNAEIENLKVKNAEIENAVIDKATIEDLEAVNAVIENLKAKDAEIENLVADKATINDLNAVNADIQNLKAQHAHIEDLVADKADIEDLEATNAEIENLKVKDAEIENLVADKATIEDLEATKAEIEVLDADFAEIKTLVSGNLTSDNILSFNITADKVTMEDAFIKDAMIDTVNAAKINAGRINTNSVVIGSEDGGMRISGATQQFTDKNGNVRIQIGRDASNDFTFALYGEDGQGQIINQNGITASAIADGLIVNDMVSDNAAISGGKLDISSVVTEINNDNTTTIKSNKIYLDEQNQSLEVAFKSLKTQVDTIKDIDSDLTTITDKIQSNTSKIEVNKSSISTLLAEDAAIKKQVTDLEGNVVETTNTLTSKYTSLQQNLDGFKTTVNNTYATKTSVNDVKNNLSSNYSTTSAMNSAINQKVDEITASVSSTYATKNEVKTIDDNIKANYSTTNQMTSAINVAKDEINLGISKVYETKTEVNNKVSNAINNIQIGASNLLKNTKTFSEGYSRVGTSTLTPNGYNGFTVYYNKYVGGDAYKDFSHGNAIAPEPNQTYTLSFWAKGNGLITNYFYPDTVKSGVNSQGATTTASDGNIKITLTDTWTKYWITWTTLGSVSGVKNIILARQLSSTDSEVYLCGVKFEKGNKATDWIPAIEDINKDIDGAETNAISESKNYTDSQIKISKDAIELGVSQTYETKSSVTSQISNTLTSAKSYADTKKSEAISTASSDATSKANNALNSAKSYADTKKSEAITSANNTLNSTIANYYTKTQTDSQIKIAKDAINLGVSETYETKTNVTSKVNSAISTASSDATSKANNALNSAKSYADTKKSEAITSANNTLNSTIANYYTKAQTDSQIKIAKDAIDLSVKTLEKEITNIETNVDNIKIGGRNLLVGTDGSKNSHLVGASPVASVGISATSSKTSGTLKITTVSTDVENYYRFMSPTNQNMWGLEPGATYVISGYARAKLNNYVQFRWQHSNGTSWVSEGGERLSVNSTGFTYFAQKMTIPKDAKGVYISFQMYGVVVGDWTEFKQLKFEKASLPSTWSPAPEDITTDINTAKNDAITSANNTLNTTIANYYTKTETDSQIKIAKDAINLGVSQTYETKTNVTSKVNSAISTASSDATTKANNALSSAKSYADTKKSEAITSANNTLNSTIANYYTKAQTDSAINVAKNSITQRVEVTEKELKELTVGGVNLLSGTKDLNGWGIPSGGTTNQTQDGFKVYYNKYTYVQGQYKDFGKDGAITPKPNQTYTLSFWAKGNGSINSYFYPNTVKSGVNSQGKTTTLEDGAITTTLSSTWTKYWITWTTLSSVTGSKNVIVCRQINSNSEVYIYGIKLEEGNKATSWSEYPETINTNITNLTTRMSAAESKITDTAITNVVKQNFYTKSETDGQITSKGYQTASQVQQTVNNLQLKFTQSGGYNLFSNSGFKKGTSYWGTHAHNSPTGGSIETLASSATWGFPDSTVNCVQIKLSNQSGKEYGITQSVKTTIGKKYTLSFYYAGHRLNQINAIVRNSSGGWLANKYVNTFPNGGNTNVGNWSKYNLTFTANATSHNINIVIVSAANDGYLWVAKPMVVEGELDLPYSPNPNEMYDGIIEMNRDGIKVSTSNGGWTDFTSAGMNVYNKAGNLSLGTRNGGLTYHNKKGYIGFTSESVVNTYDVSGVTISTANAGSYITLGTSTTTDPFGGFTSTPALSIAKADIGDANTSFYHQGVNLHTTLNVNTKPIKQVGTMYYGINGMTRTYESTTGNLCLLGDNGVVLGYYQGNDIVTKFKIIEGSSASESYIDTYAHWRFHGWNLTDVANLSIKNNIKMETTATIQFNSTATYPSLIWEASNRLKLYGNDGIDFGYRNGSSNMPIFKLHEGADTAYRIESFSHWNFNNWNLENVGILKPQRLQLPSTYGSNWIGLGTGDGNDYTTYNVKFRTHNGLAFTDNGDSATVIVQGRQGRIMGKNAYYVNCSRSLKSDIRSVISEDDVTTFVAKEGESLDTNISAETVCDFLDAIDVKTYVTDFKQEGATQECFDIEKGNSLTLGYIADDIAEHPMFKYVGEKTNDGLYAINSNSLTTTLIVGYQQEKRKREQLEQRLLELERLLKGDK